MRRRNLLPVLFGLAVGVTARITLPGHGPVSLLVTALLSMAGGAGGNAIAGAALPVEAAETGCYILSGLGALAMMLLWALFSH